MENLLQETKDTVAREHGYENWRQVLRAYRHEKLLGAGLQVLENMAMHRFAEICCNEQRDYDSEHAELHDDSNCYSEGGYCSNTRVDNEAILKHPLATDKYKPQK